MKGRPCIVIVGYFAFLASHVSCVSAGSLVGFITHATTVGPEAARPETPHRASTVVHVTLTQRALHNLRHKFMLALNTQTRPRLYNEHTTDSWSHCGSFFSCTQHSLTESKQQLDSARDALRAYTQVRTLQLHSRQP